MTAHIVATALLLAGAILLTVGPALQAVHELTQYQDIMEASPLVESFTETLPPWVKTWIKVTQFANAFSPTVIEASGRVIRALRWVSEQRSQLDTIADPTEKEVWAAYLDRMSHALALARNWMIVTLGAAIVVVGATVEFVITLTE